MENIKFTLIVPTRERSDTLFFCLKTLLAQTYTNFEILVSDNFSQDDTEKVVQSFSDPKIRYFNTGKRISMSHNWEFALSQVNSGWVMFIGDDDGLLPFALKTLNEVIQASQCQALTVATCSFAWPGHPLEPEGSLTVPLLPKNIYCKKKSSEMLLKVLNGQARYQELPWLYNGGAASIELINRLRNDNKQFFLSQIPDVYSAIALSLATKEYAFVEVPIAINGASKHSGGTSFMLGQKNDKDSPSHKFSSEDNIPFHKSLVFGKSLQIIVYESYLQASHLYESLITHLSLQLEVAIATAPRLFKPEITADCFKIASLNHIPPPLSWNILTRRIVYRCNSVITNLLQWKVINIRASDIGVNDVYEASLAINYIYQAVNCATRRNFLLKAFVYSFLFLTHVSKQFIRITSRLIAFKDRN